SRGDGRGRIDRDDGDALDLPGCCGDEADARVGADRPFGGGLPAPEPRQPPRVGVGRRRMRNERERRKEKGGPHKTSCHTHQNATCTPVPNRKPARSMPSNPAKSFCNESRATTDLPSTLRYTCFIIRISAPSATYALGAQPLDSRFA